MVIKRNHIFLSLWFIASIFWAMECSHRSGFPTAIQTYSTAMDLANEIADRSATSYQKKLYMSYGPRIEYANGKILIFVASGIGIPLVVLFLGRWILVKTAAKPVKKPVVQKQNKF